MANLKSYAYTILNVIFFGLVTYLISYISIGQLPKYLQMLGGVLLLAGVLIRVWSTTLFFKHKKQIIAINPSNQILLKEGPYKFSRNPLYIGWFFMLFGYSFIFHSLSVLVFSILFILLTHLYVFYIEEERLVKALGDQYKKYTNEVSRWW